MADTLVLGLGGTVDYEIRWDGAVLEGLAREHGIRREELSTTAPIRDERDLVVAILGFLAADAGGERFVAASATIEAFAARFETTVTLGGTGVRAGLALDRLGIGSVQHLVSIDDTVRRLLPATITTVCSATEDSLDPHLIVQYPRDARVRLVDGEVVAGAANRVIFANDPPNRAMAIAPALSAALAGAGAFLVSGFNTMQDAALLRRRLGELRGALVYLPSDALLYYEDAGFYDRSFAWTVREALLGRIDVYGMNEDELAEYLGRTVDLTDPDDVAAALAAVHRLFPAPALVVHTRHWAVAVGPRAHEHRDAVELAVRVAATRYRIGDALTADAVADTAGLARDAAGERVVAALTRLLPGAAGVAAYDVDVAEPTTIGLGDTFVGGFLAAVYARRAVTA